MKQEGYILTDRRNGARVRENFGGSAGLSGESLELLKKIASEAKISGMAKEAFIGICEQYFGG